MQCYYNPLSLRLLRKILMTDDKITFGGYLRIDRNFCSVHEEITSIRLYPPGSSRRVLRKGVYNLIEVISNNSNT